MNVREVVVVSGRLGRLVGAIVALGASVAAVATAVALVVLTACTSAVGDGRTPARPATATGHALGSDVPAASGTKSTASKAASARAAAAKAAAVKAAARHKAKAARCARNPDAQRVIVDLAKQHAWMCARHTLVYSTAVTSGMSGQWTETPTGKYRIQGRQTDTVLTLNTGAQYAVRYWIPFDGPLYGFHDSSWQHFPYGSAKYKTDGSHGCIHMPVKAMAWLYRWSAADTAVRIS